MYKLLLIRRYLGRKLAPMFAALAVTLCTAMVIIVISVMGGFLDMMRSSAQRLSGDVRVRSSWTGFPHYEQLIHELEALPQVKAATPMIRAAGMVKFGHDQVFVIPEVLGIQPGGLDQVTFYSDALYWKRSHIQDWNRRHAPSPDMKPPPGTTPSEDSSSGGSSSQAQMPDGRSEQTPDESESIPDPHAMGMRFEPPAGWVRDKPGLRGIVPGIESHPYHTRDENGQYQLIHSPLGSRVTLTVLPVTQSGGVMEPAVREFVVVNEFKSGLFEVDANRVYVPFDLLQKMQRMDEAVEVDPETGQPTGQKIPARASEIIVRGSTGTSLAGLHLAVMDLCVEFESRHPGMPPIFANTWEQRHASLLNAVENEKGLITFLFVFISMVAVVMVATTFSMIVFEKTRDIGVLRAIGASRLGVANIFLGYGLAVGTVGALAGLTLAITIVYNLNELQGLLDAWFGWRMWSPQTYYFDQIPERVDPSEMLWIAIGAVLSSVIGALIPAFLAARLDPIEALRYE